METKFDNFINQLGGETTTTITNCAQYSVVGSRGFDVRFKTCTATYVLVPIHSIVADSLDVVPNILSELTIINKTFDIGWTLAGDVVEILPKPYVRTLTANLYTAGGGLTNGGTYKENMIFCFVWPATTKSGDRPIIIETHVGRHVYNTGWSFSINNNISIVIGAYQRVAFGILASDGNAASTYYAGYDSDTTIYTHLSGTLD